MPYTKQTWTNSGASGGLAADSEANAERLNYMEEGIRVAQETAEAGGGGGGLTVSPFVNYAGGTAVRPTNDPAVIIFWRCTTASIPPVITSGTAGRYADDIVSVVAQP
jgi:hypothetical protein